MAKPEIFYTDKEIEVLRNELIDIKGSIDLGELEGELAEVGVYLGGTAKIIREEVPDVTLHLFDTFTGLPDIFKKGVDPKHYYEGHCKATLQEAKKYLKGVEGIEMYKGIFPETAKQIKNKRFAFVHIDVDIYQSTKDALEFFYPRVNIGGSIIVHDYPAHRGVQEACDEFMESRGTFYLGKWKIRQKDPMIRSGYRQLIIRRRVNAI